MEGYVKNASSMWRHAMKRSIGPGQKVPLDDLYEQYGIKHGIDQGDLFVDWLRQVKLRDTTIWEIKYRKIQPTTVVAKDIQPKKVKSEKVDPNPGKSNTQQTPFVASKATADDIATMSVRNARAMLPRFTDQKLLKYALNMASQLANKDTLCIMLRKRIIELELTRR